MKRKPNPKLVAAIAAIIVPPAIVAFAWAMAYVPMFTYVLLFVMGALFALFIYKVTLWFMEHWDGFKEMIKDMRK